LAGDREERLASHVLEVVPHQRFDLALVQLGATANLAECRKRVAVDLEDRHTAILAWWEAIDF